MTIAYCYADGRIGFGPLLPIGALEITRGPEKKLRKIITATARLADDNETWLVPGVPEAPDQGEGIKALCRYVEQVENRLTH